MFSSSTCWSSSGSVGKSWWLLLLWFIIIIIIFILMTLDILRMMNRYLWWLGRHWRRIEWHWWWRSWIIGRQWCHGCGAKHMWWTSTITWLMREKTIWGRDMLEWCVWWVAKLRMWMSKHLTLTHRRLSEKRLRMMYEIWRRPNMASVGLWSRLGRFLWQHCSLNNMVNMVITMNKYVW